MLPIIFSTLAGVSGSLKMVRWWLWSMFLSLLIYGNKELFSHLNKFPLIIKGCKTSVQLDQNFFCKQEIGQHNKLDV